MEKKVTDLTIEETVKEGNWVVDCWAPWCGPCMMVDPILKEIAEELEGKVNIGKLNVDENKLTANKYQIMSIPTLLFFKNGVAIGKIIGAYPKEQLLKTIKEVFEV